jgi:glycosyltransferase involved in cell wall biosynthesis
VADKRAIAIVERPPQRPWSPHDLDTTGLAGSQTSYVFLARHLVELGHEVSFFGGGTETVDRGVSYHRRRAFDPSANWDMVIGARLPTVLRWVPDSAVRVMWAHDTQYGDEITEALAARMDAVVVGSAWAAGRMTEVYPYLTERIRVIPNGVEPSYYSDLSRPRRPRLVYTSAPERGLDVILELWPQIRRQVPRAELAYCYPAVYDLWPEKYPGFRQLYERIARLSRQDGVEYLGSLGHKTLAELLCESRVWVGPSWSTLRNSVFPETFCLSAAQAQVAGCWVVASRAAALPETVRVGRLLGEEPGTAAWRSELVEAVVAGLSDEELRLRAIAAAPAAAAAFDCRVTLARFAGLLQAARS